MSPTEWESCHSIDANPRQWYASHLGLLLSPIHGTMLLCGTPTGSNGGYRLLIWQDLDGACRYEQTALLSLQWSI